MGLEKEREKVKESVGWSKKGYRLFDLCSCAINLGQLIETSVQISIGRRE